MRQMAQGPETGFEEITPRKSAYRIATIRTALRGLFVVSAVRQTSA
jgi:hypothetical protein